MKQFGRSAIVASLAAIGVAAAATAALAAQGSGSAPGTAGAITQLAMAVLIYGLSAAIVAVGLLSALKQH
jgi:hypothetical protein